MSSNAKRRRPATRAIVEAPGEFAFSAGDTPKPGRVGERPAEARSGFPRAWTAIKLAFGMAIVVAASLMIAWGVHQFAVTTPRFAIAGFAVEGNRRASDDRIVRAAGLEKGRNIFAVDLDAAQRSLLEDPWIESVRITRQLPRTVRIELSERRAVALALLENDLYVLDTAGLPFKKLSADDPHDLPVVTGLTVEGLALDRERALERARQAIEVLRAYESLPLAQVHPLEELHLEPEGSIVLQIGKGGTALHLGRTEWRRRLAMAARVVGKVSAQGTVPGIVFLDNEAHEERVVVRMR
jgi:cell division protein FtsQ